MDHLKKVKMRLCNFPPIFFIVLSNCSWRKLATIFNVATSDMIKYKKCENGVSDTLFSGNMTDGVSLSQQLSRVPGSDNYYYYCFILL